MTGIGWAAGYGEPADSVTEVGDVPSASGTAMAIRAETFRALGGFAEELFMYLEDLELGWRARLAGYRVVVDPAADVFHEYEYGRNPRKSYFLERNRLIFCLSAYSGRQLLLLSPVLLATELGMVALAVKERWFRDKVAGWGWLARNAQARSPAAPRDPEPEARARSRSRRAPDAHLLARDASGTRSPSPGEPARARLLAPGQEGTLRTSSCTSRPARAGRRARRNFVGTRTP